MKIHVGLWGGSVGNMPYAKILVSLSGLGQLGPLQSWHMSLSQWGMSADSSAAVTKRAETGFACDLTCRMLLMSLGDMMSLGS